MSDTANAYDNLLDTLRGEFVGEAEDNLNEIEILLGNLRSGVENPKEAMIKIKRPAHSLKGSSSVAEFPLVTVIMHRLEDYIAPLKEITPEHIENIQIYVDKARECSLLDCDQKSISAADLARALPKRPSEGEAAMPAEGKAAPARTIEALMVIKEKTAGMIFERELNKSGLHVTTVRSSFEALEMIVRTQPDLVLLSGVVDVLSGVDIACALAAMPATKHIPVCLLTSFERGHQDLEGLPDAIPLVRKNHLKDDLAATLKQYKLAG